MELVVIISETHNPSMVESLLGKFGTHTVCNVSQKAIFISYSQCKYKIKSLLHYGQFVISTFQRKLTQHLNDLPKYPLVLQQ